jgi:hypothetical protein
MSIKRPTAVVVAGVFQLALGAYGVLDALSTLLGGGGLAALQQLGAVKTTLFDPKELLGYLNEHLPNLVPVLVAESVASGLLSVLMIVSAVGLFRMRPWARSVTLVYAAISAVLCLVEAGCVVAYLVPALQGFGEICRQQSPREGGDVLAFIFTATGYGTAAGVLLGLLYPLLIFVLMMLRSTRAAFAAAGAAQPAAPVPEPDGPAAVPLPQSGPSTGLQPGQGPPHPSPEGGRAADDAGAGPAP